MKSSLAVGMLFCMAFVMGCGRSVETALSKDNMERGFTNVVRQLKFGTEEREIEFLKINDVFIAEDLLSERDFMSLIGGSCTRCCPTLGITWIDAVWACSQVASNSVDNGLLLNDEIIRLPTRKEMALFFGSSHITAESYKRDLCEACRQSHQISEWTFDIEKNGATCAYAWVVSLDEDWISVGQTNNIVLLPCHRANQDSSFRVVIAKKCQNGEDSYREYYSLVDQINNLKLKQRGYHPPLHDAVEVKDLPFLDKDDVLIEIPSNL